MEWVAPKSCRLRTRNFTCMLRIEEAWVLGADFVPAEVQILFQKKITAQYLKLVYVIWHQGYDEKTAELVRAWLVSELVHAKVSCLVNCTSLDWLVGDAAVENLIPTNTLQTEGLNGTCEVVRLSIPSGKIKTTAPGKEPSCQEQ